ncbi:MAG: alcohol dehydrogenase catalytic domain-containing protein [Pseudomonadota bacterium]
MSLGRSLSCSDPASGKLEVVEFERAVPKPGEIEIAVDATSVNPIDVHRSTGYGRTLLSLLGAGTFPMVLGNDYLGTISAVGEGVRSFGIGDRVFGARKPSRAGTHASHVIATAKADTVMLLPDGLDQTAIAAVPYSFTTMWLAVRDAGLDRPNAPNKRVLVHGAAGGLGSLALQMLSEWGCNVTAIAFPKDHDACLRLGASNAVDLSTTPFRDLAGAFDATLNFATWDHDAQLPGCLRRNALGHATTVHPMLRTFDENGLVLGGIKTVIGKRRSRKALPQGAGKYGWTIFKPQEEALRELVRLLQRGRAKLDIGIEVPLSDGANAFDHIRTGQAGRALITP